MEEVGRGQCCGNAAGNTDLDGRACGIIVHEAPTPECHLVRDQNVLLNTGILLPRVGDGFLGSCFVFRYATTFLTAAHCVKDLAPRDVGVLLPGAPAEYAFGVVNITCHPQADLAVLQVPEVREEQVTWPQYTLFDDRELGVEFTACGYPQEFRHIAHIAVGQPTLRVFRGYVQRFFPHTSHMGYRYFAAELSTPCPAGLSGAPVFNSGFHGRLYGVVAEDVKTSTELESVIEVKDGDKTREELYHNVIHYGVAVWLPAIASWLDQIVPPVSDEEIQRRGANQQRLRKQQQVGQ